MTFNWTFTDQNTTNPVSGTIDLPGSTDGLYWLGVTATVTQVPVSWGTQNYGALSYSFGDGIKLLNGAIDQSGSNYILLYDGVSDAGLQFAAQGSGLQKAAFSDNNLARTASSPTTVASFTAVPAPLPLLGLGAAAAFSRKLKQRIALRRKRQEVGEAG